MRTVRITSLVLASVLSLPFVLAACSSGDDGDDDAEAFATLQDCFDEHHNEEALTVPHAITTCCLDHPIAGMHPSCGTTVDDCETHVGTNLDASSATSEDISAACTDYIGQM
jgi:hypothetical protein